MSKESIYINDHYIAVFMLNTFVYHREEGR